MAKQATPLPPHPRDGNLDKLRTATHLAADGQRWPTVTFDSATHVVKYGDYPHCWEADAHVQLRWNLVQHGWTPARSKVTHPNRVGIRGLVYETTPRARREFLAAYGLTERCPRYLKGGE